MSEKHGLIIDVSRSDGCGSDILSIADEMTARLNKPEDSEIPEGKAKEWFAMEEIESGQNNKVKLDYIPRMFPINDGPTAEEVIFDDPTQNMVFTKNENVIYTNIPSPFVTGEIANTDGTECMACITAKLICKKTKEVFETDTDFFGDFQFSGLKSGNDYCLIIDDKIYKEFCFEESFDIGTIFVE